VVVVFHHLTGDMPGDAQDRRFRCAGFEQFRDALVAKIVETESLQAGSSRELAPGRAPRLLWAGCVDAGMLAGWENVGLRAGDPKSIGPLK
jgi:hypothetical protein